ncbi:MAG: hypothetical protein P8X90_23645, partial [Desulfobacterales bacterium]|jgi:hypothetical protein
MTRSTIVAVLAICLMAAGCSSLRLRDPMENFEDANRAYGRAISWAEYVVAAAFLKPDDQDNVAAQIERLSNFRVTAYEPRLLRVLEKDARIRQIVKISYFRKDTLVVKATLDDQLWEYDTEQSSWFLTTGFPKLD